MQKQTVHKWTELWLLVLHWVEALKCLALAPFLCLTVYCLLLIWSLEISWLFPDLQPWSFLPSTDLNPWSFLPSLYLMPVSFLPSTDLNPWNFLPCMSWCLTVSCLLLIWILEISWLFPDLMSDSFLPSANCPQLIWMLASVDLKPGQLVDGDQTNLKHTWSQINQLSSHSFSTCLVQV